jgi:5-methylcytosine-specific restriction endonuclease McrA
MSEWRQKYEAHIRSDRWAKLKRDLIRLRGARCQHCGARTALQLHHKTYARLGRELTCDLELLCWRCHERADRKREQQNRAQRHCA